MFRMYNINDVPEHIIEEINEVIQNLAVAFGDIIHGKDFNIAMSALNLFHASSIVHFCEKDHLKQCVETEAIALIKNVEHISQEKIFTDPEDPAV